METKSLDTLRREILEIQLKHLEQWRKVLKFEAFEMLVMKCQEENKHTFDPYKIFRGTEMDNYIHNVIMKNLS